AVSAMELDDLADVQVGDAVSVCEEEQVRIHVFLDSLDTRAGLRRHAGIRQRHLPLLAVLAVMNVEGSARRTERHREVVEEQLVLREEALDDFALVAEAQHEVAEAAVRVGLHDVPEDWTSADLDHRLGTHIGLLAQPRPHSSAKNHDLGY